MTCPSEDGLSYPVFEDNKGGRLFCNENIFCYLNYLICKEFTREIISNNRDW